MAFSSFTPSGAKYVPLLTVFDGQTGAVRYSKTFAAGDGVGPVAVTANGSWVSWEAGAGLNIYDGTTGALRAMLPGLGVAAMSDSGDFLASAGEDSATIWAWDAPSQQYKAAFTLAPPGGGTWFCMDLAVSSDGSGAADKELAAFGWIDETSRTARLTIASMVTGAWVSDFTTATNAQLQTSPTVRMDSVYAGMALWGDNDDVPTATVLQAGSNTPVFTYTTPGSMFAVDIVRDATASTPSNDVLYFAVAGKHVPANAMGNGGDAYAWRINVAL